MDPHGSGRSRFPRLTPGNPYKAKSIDIGIHQYESGRIREIRYIDISRTVPAVVGHHASYK